MKTADLILINGKVFSVSLDGAVFKAEAVAIEDDRILAVGETKELMKLADKETRYIDCQGNTVFPGLCDAHCHPSVSASAYSGCNLFGVYIQEGQTEEDIIDEYMKRLKVFIDKHQDDELIRGTGWVLGNFMGDRVPTRHDIDKICSDRPVILESFCQHNLWVNTKAIEVAGVNEKTPDVYAGKIYREKGGFPQGIFNDPEAMELIKANVPGYDFSIEKYKEAFLYYQKNYANKYGVTLVQDCMHSDNAREAFKELAEEGKLTLRIRGIYLIEPGKEDRQLPLAIARKDKGVDNIGDDFRIDTVKIFSEGMFSLIEPYEKDFIRENGLPEDYNAELYWSDEALVETSKKSMEAGLGVHIHAMGDNAVRQSVDCLAKAQRAVRYISKENEPNDIGKPIEQYDFRNVIAHLMLIRDEDIDMMAEEKIIGNCQPRWMVYDSDIEGMTPMVGEERVGKAYPLRCFLDKGVRISFGTDFPVTPPPDTMHEIQCAMTRSVFPDAPDYGRFKGKVLGSERPADLHETVQALSINGAYQMFADHITGSIEPGKSADLVILDSDIEGCDVEGIYNIKVDKTIFKGKIVYEA